MAHIPGYNFYGDLPASEGAIGSTGEGQRLFIRAFSLYNKSGGSETFTIKINGRFWRTETLAAGDSIELIGTEVMMLGESESITGYSSNASAVDYIVSTILRV